MNKIHIFLLALLGCVTAASGQTAKARYGVFAIRNATLITVSGDTLRGNLVMRDEKIAALGANAAIPADAEVIDGTGKFVYPGFIDSGTKIGLEEVRSIELTQDFQEVGDVTPQMQALTAVNPNTVHIPVNRAGGVTTALAVPAGGIFPGTAALIHLHGYTPEAMYAGYKAVTMNFPSAARRGRFDRRTDEDLKKDLDKKLKTISDLWAEVRLWAKVDSAHKAGKSAAPAYRPDLAALAPVVAGTAPLMIEVNTAEDIKAAIAWVKENKVQAVFTGVAEGWRVAADLAASGIPVITGPMMSTPVREYDRYDRPYANPGLLHAAGVKVAIRTSQTENVRNLPFNAGFAAAYGMDKAAALKAITLYPAQIFGLDKELGSLEVGKSATLIVADGDPFETRSQITHVFIRGWLMPDDNRQLGLYREFLERSPKE